MKVTEILFEYSFLASSSHFEGTLNVPVRYLKRLFGLQEVKNGVGVSKYHNFTVKMVKKMINTT